MPSPAMLSPETRTKKVEAGLWTSSRLRSSGESRKSSAGEGNPALTGLPATGISCRVVRSGVWKVSMSCFLSMSESGEFRLRKYEKFGENRSVVCLPCVAAAGTVAFTPFRTGSSKKNIPLKIVYNRK